MTVGRREEILQVAVEFFSEKGYHATSMRDIANGLGMRAGSLYAHINGKEELLYEILDRAADQFLAAVRTALRDTGHGQADPRTALRLAMRAHLAVMAENRATSTVFFHEWKALNPDLRQRIKRKRDSYEQLFGDILAEGVRTGVFRSVSLPMARLALMSMCNWFYHWYSPDGGFTVEEIADQFAELFLQGIETPSVERTPAAG